MAVQRSIIKNESASSGRRLFPWFIILSIFVAISVFYFFYYRSTESEYYSVVYLDTGDIYFGVLSDKDKDYTTLRDVYYFKDSSFIKQNGVTLGALPEEGNFSLTKMGSEVHAPEDSILISAKHIVFLGKLSSKSKVLEAILSHKGD